MDEFNSSEKNSEAKSTGPVIGSVIIILVLIIGALYFWGAKLNKEQNQTPGELMEAYDPTLTELEGQNSSDDMESIRSDLEASQFDDIDAELDAESKNYTE